MHFSIPALFAWALENKTQFLVDVGAVVGGASALVKAIDALIALLVGVLPWLRGVDGELKSVAAFLDKIAGSSILNAVALNRVPRPNAGPALKALVAVLALGLAFHPAPANAQVLVSSGPTLPLLELRPGQPHPVQLAPGAGIQLSLTEASFTRAIGGKSWDLLDVNLMLFGTAVSATSGETFGALSAAVGLCFMSSAICLGGGRDLVTSGGLKPGFFGLVALNFNMALAPSSPPAGVSSGALGLPRGNTLFLGAP